MAKKKGVVIPGKIIYIGGSEWSVAESGHKKAIEQLQDGNPEGFTTYGRCFAGNKQILVRKGLDKQQRYETFVHEGVHAICDEYSCFEPFNTIFKSEELTSILTKSLISYLRQIRDAGFTTG